MAKRLHIGRTHPGDTVETFDPWKTGLPRFDGHVNDSKYVIPNDKQHTPEQVEQSLQAEFKHANAIEATL